MNTKLNTKFVGIKDFRENIALYAKKARTTKARYVVMSHRQPLFEVVPFDEEETLETYLDSFMEGIEEAKRDVAAGRVVSQKEILAEFAKI